MHEFQQSVNKQQQQYTERRYEYVRFRRERDVMRIVIGK